jgi:hypothetical protein
MERRECFYEKMAEMSKEPSTIQCFGQIRLYIDRRKLRRVDRAPSPVIRTETILL